MRDAREPHGHNAALYTRPVSRGSGARLEVIGSTASGRIPHNDLPAVRAIVALTLLVPGILTVTAGHRTANDRDQASAAEPGAFLLAGDPESSSGATWTFRGTVEGTRYDLTGVLLKPAGPGPFPAVVLSHGSEGSDAMLAALAGRTMVGWGRVCIAPNYTHASADVPKGAPGGANDLGASRASVLRAHMAHELLRRLGYVDLSRVALPG